MQWSRFLASGRREVPLLAYVAYDSARVKRARDAAKTAGLHGVAVMTAAPCFAAVSCKDEAGRACCGRSLPVLLS